jgi:cysteine desulfuration protein SufE
MKQLPERLDQLMTTLDALDRNERIQTLVDIAKRFRPVTPDIAQRPFPKDRRVPGCESEAYVWSLPNPNGTLDYRFAVENPQGISAMALAAILSKTVSGLTPTEILTVPPDIIYRIFGAELSMGKSLGLMGMVNMVRAEAKHQLEKTLPTEPDAA